MIKIEAEEKHKSTMSKFPFTLLGVIDLLLAANIGTIKKTIQSIKSH